MKKKKFKGISGCRIYIINRALLYEYDTTDRVAFSLFQSEKLNSPSKSKSSNSSRFGIWQFEGIKTLSMI